jgi:ubiquinone/menaquinone biosynthesis C-methylase UbiE
MNDNNESQDTYWANISKYNSNLYSIWHSTRDKEYRKLLNYYISQLDAEKIMDVGSGIGLNVLNLNKTVVCCDLDFGALNYSKNIFSLSNQVNASSTNLPFKDNSFDLILSSMLFSNISQYTKTANHITNCF